jgi:transposase
MVKEQGAASIIAEIGADKDIFPSEGHLSTWAGMSPGNNGSVGKKGGKTTHGNQNLRTDPV